jgi:hypothetical protein
MHSVETVDRLNTVKITVQTGRHDAEEAKAISQSVTLAQRDFIGDFRYWMVVVPSDRPMADENCKLLQADIVVRKILGLKAVIIQIDPTDEASLHAAREIKCAFERTVDTVEVVHGETAALRALHALHAASVKV